MCCLAATKANIDDITRQRDYKTRRVSLEARQIDRVGAGVLPIVTNIYTVLYEASNDMDHAECRASPASQE